MFESSLPAAQFLPTLVRKKTCTWAEIEIGFNFDLAKLYTLRVYLHDSVYCEDLGDVAAEIMFVICMYDSRDPDAETEILWDGQETRRHFPDPQFRVAVTNFIATLGAYLVEVTKPKRLIFVTKFENLPLVAHAKYDKLSEKIVALGYKSNNYSIVAGKQLWDLSR